MPFWSNWSSGTKWAVVAGLGAVLVGSGLYLRRRLGRIPSCPFDPSSFANNHQITLNNFHLNLSVDFSARVLSGYVDFALTAQTATRTMMLDTRDLAIRRVLDVTDTPTPLLWKLHAPHKALGAALQIRLAKELKQGEKLSVRVEYSTSPDSTAVQWLSPEQTAGKKFPYLFTQCQAIHARSLFPCQDTPSSKSPYSAKISVPCPLRALMSALQNEELDEKNNEESEDVQHFHFEQPVPMPAYLVALAVGALEKRSLGPRSAVWSEKEMVEAGAFEFADTEKFLSAAEAICGPYVWGRYDILLLPPSFPYGGMENPCLTFVTPTLLAGDRSLSNVVAHEVAHSWMGNLVSPMNWEHFWLNEGFTVFLERKIVAAVEGKASAELHALIGMKALRESVQHYGEDHRFTRLVVPLENEDPDDAFSSVPYEKGYLFLRYLQERVGGEEVMNKFLRAHCDEFGFKSIDSEQWQGFFLDYFKDKMSSEQLNAIDWQTWFHSPGEPQLPEFDTSLADQCHQLAVKLVREGYAPRRTDVAPWSSDQMTVFLERMQELQLESNNTSEEKEAFEIVLRAVGKVYALETSKNAEIRFRWNTLVLRAGMREKYEDVVSFLGEQGRMKFVRPLFRDLFSATEGKELALASFERLRPQYHSICQKMVSRDLGV